MSKYSSEILDLTIYTKNILRMLNLCSETTYTRGRREEEEEEEEEEDEEEEEGEEEEGGGGRGAAAEEEQKQEQGQQQVEQKNSRGSPVNCKRHKRPYWLSLVHKFSRLILVFSS